jgi:hypothetical protein
MENYEIQKAEKVAETEKKTPVHFESAKELPKSVKEYLDKVPDRIKKKLFPEEKNLDRKDGKETEMERYEEIVATMTEREREDFMKKCFFELFYETGISDAFKDLDKERLTEEVSRITDVLWSNRGKRGEEIKLFNAEYYDKFFADRDSLEADIRSKKLEVEKAKEANDKRKTDSKDSKIYQKYSELRGELDGLRKEMENLDNKHGNAEFYRIVGKGVDGRKAREAKWTEAVAVLEEYLDPTEFATLMAEQMGSVFSVESRLASKKPGDKYFGYELSEEAIDRAKSIIKKITDAIENWAISHEGDGVIKQAQDIKAEEKILKLVEYFQSLLMSYKDGKRRGRKDEELNAEIKLMENTLNLLSKK